MEGKREGERERDGGTDRRGQKETGKDRTLMVGITGVQGERPLGE